LVIKYFYVFVCLPIELGPWHVLGRRSSCSTRGHRADGHQMGARWAPDRRAGTARSQGLVRRCRKHPAGPDRPGRPRRSAWPPRWVG